MQKGQLSQMMHVTESMLTPVLPVAGPPIMDPDASEDGKNANGIQGLSPTLGVNGVVGQSRRATAVHPIACSHHVQRRFILIEHLAGLQCLFDLLFYGGHLLLRSDEHAYNALQDARQHQETPEFRALYAKRAGVEGTVAQAVRTCEIRRSRYIGQKKLNLQTFLTATAMNVLRACHWFKRRKTCYYSFFLLCKADCFDSTRIRCLEEANSPTLS